jgi:hypothetical protein
MNISLKLIASVIIPILLMTPTLSAQDYPETGYEAIVDTFFTRFANHDNAGAVDYLYSDSLWLYGDSENIQDLKTKISALNEIAGVYVSHELLIEEKLLDNAVYLIYLVLLENHPFQFEFKFYKSRTKWHTYGFSYNDDVFGLLETRALYKLNIAEDED